MNMVTESTTHPTPQAFHHQPMWMAHAVKVMQCSVSCTACATFGMNSAPTEGDVPQCNTCGAFWL